MESYNGHRSWNAWNVSLWLNNAEWLEYEMRAYVDKGLSNFAIFNNIKWLVGDRTPDGGKVTAMSLRTYIEEFQS